MAVGPRAVLMVQGGPDEGNTIPLPEGMATMGRAALNHIVVDEPGVSRQHAAIRSDSEGCTLSDLGSRNGTFVNDEAVTQEGRRLRNWDRVKLGGMITHWVFMESQDTVEIARPPSG